MVLMMILLHFETLKLLFPMFFGFEMSPRIVNVIFLSLSLSPLWFKDLHSTREHKGPQESKEERVFVGA